ncbi:MAG: RsmB/NOP family class I SAM-dependent RNA methyltransferase [Pseudomonadota bacterium]|nr:RsmB/NOP family class I SAM-dependent RNA methyltransferase [Pseudomonadota bacterium]
MTPAARVQSAIELLDLIIAAARGQGASADRIVAEWFKTRRYMGSGDRRAVRELVYGAVRACGEIPVSGRAAMLRLGQGDPAILPLFDGSPHAPDPLVPGEPVASTGIAPRWLEEKLAQSGIAGDEAAALLGRAPLDVRVNPLKGDIGALPLAGGPTQAPNALRFPAGTPVEQWEAYHAGLIEVQDTGSQLCCMELAARPGETVLDLCAGAGGKTLALAAAMDNRGRLIATDTDRGRLSRLASRAARAGAINFDSRLLNPGREAEILADLAGQCDAVLVDAPCSGTGTWRRNPEARWRLSGAELARLTTLQMRLIDLAATLIKPGGRLVYVTCSLLDEEGASQAEAFLQRHPEWSAQPPELAAGTPRGLGLRLSPAHDATDGFFIARFVSP